ncbi:16735_t:CDS:1, partial [Acaulospora morrowiae]
MAVSSFSPSISSSVSSLPAPCLLSIFKNLIIESFEVQRNLVLINRHWCTILTPELWRDPFGYSGRRSDQHIKLIDTYFKCLPKDVGQKIIEEIRETLNSNHTGINGNSDNHINDDSGYSDNSSDHGKVTKNSNRRAVFEYHKYLRHLHLDEIYSSISEWYEKNVSKKVISASTKGSQKLYLYRMILQNFVAHSSNIKELTLNGKREALHINIYDLPQAESTLTSLRFLNLDVSFSLQPGAGEMLSGILFSSSYFSTHLQEIKISLSAEGDVGAVEQLARLIESQRELKKISIECFEMDFQIIWKSVVNHNQDNLVILNLRYLNFQQESPFQLDSLKVFSNLEVLKIIQCENFDFYGS